MGIDFAGLRKSPAPPKVQWRDLSPAEQRRLLAAAQAPEPEPVDWLDRLLIWIRRRLAP